MPKQTSIQLARFLIFLFAAAMTNVVTAHEESLPVEISNQLDTLLDEKLDNYRRWYPEIMFLSLKGGDETIADMVMLGQVLGKKPTSLDYEHPPELREDLMTVSMNRILVLLQALMPSSSLFRADEQLDGQELICVIAIHPHEIAADTNMATQHLLDQPMEFINKIPEHLKLAPEDYLEFVIDHEIYHCLKSMYVGPQKMSHKDLWGDYSQFHNEMGADTYALGMHIRKMGKVTPFVNNVQLIRGTSLLSADVNHLTCKAIERLIKTPVKKISQMNSREVFAMANGIKKDITIDYDAYVQYLASAIQAMDELDVGFLASEEFRKRTSGSTADPVQVEALVARANYCLSKLKGQNAEP